MPRRGQRSVSSEPTLFGISILLSRTSSRVCLYLANCYGEPIFTGNRAANLRKWAESHFRTLLVAVKRSEPRTTLRSRNSE